MKITSRTIKRGNPCESEWPSELPTGDKGVFHIGEDGRLTEGYPDPGIQKFGEAPYVIQDTIDRFYHERAKKFVDSRSEMERLDKATGLLTSGTKQAPDPTWSNEQRRRRIQDGKEKLRWAAHALDNGEVKLPPDVQALCDIQNKIIQDNTGLDAFNAVGRVTDPRGKRFKRPKRKKK